MMKRMNVNVLWLTGLLVMTLSALTSTTSAQDQKFEKTPLYAALVAQEQVEKTRIDTSATPRSDSLLLALLEEKYQNSQVLQKIERLQGLIEKKDPSTHRPKKLAIPKLHFTPRSSFNFAEKKILTGGFDIFTNVGKNGRLGEFRSGVSLNTRKFVFGSANLRINLGGRYGTTRNISFGFGATRSLDEVRTPYVQKAISVRFGQDQLDKWWRKFELRHGFGFSYWLPLEIWKHPKDRHEPRVPKYIGLGVWQVLLIKALPIVNVSPGLSFSATIRTDTWRAGVKPQLMLHVSKK